MTDTLTQPLLIEHKCGVVLGRSQSGHKTIPRHLKKLALRKTTQQEKALRKQNEKQQKKKKNCLIY